MPLESAADGEPTVQLAEVPVTMPGMPVSARVGSQLTAPPDNALAIERRHLYLVLVIGWLLGAGLLTIRLWQSYRRLWAALRGATNAESTAQTICRDVSQMLGVRAPKVFRSPYFASPFLAGIRELQLG